MIYNRKLVFAAACAGLFLFGVGVITFGAIAPDLKAKFALDELGIGTIFSLFTVGVLVGSLGFGPIADRFGYKILLAVCSLIMGLGFTSLGMAEALVVIQIGVLLIGIGGGAINGATSALVADISEGNKGASLALFSAFFGLGALAMPFVLGLLRDLVPFESILLFISALCFILTLVYVLLQFPMAKQQEGMSLTTAGQMLRDPILLLIGLFLFWQSANEALINNWTTSYLRDTLHIDGRWTLYALSFYVAGLIAMRLLTGSIFRKTPAVKMLGIGLRLFLIGALTFAWSSSLIWTIVGLVLIGLGLALGFPVMFGISSTRYQNASGTAIGIVLTISLIGNLSTNYAMGFLAKTYGIDILPGILILVVGIQMLCFYLVLRKTR
jgi:MFS family permease